MNIRRLIIACAVAVCLAMPLLSSAEEPVVKTGAASSVAEFLQMREERQLRARLVAEGRLDELRKLDAERTSRRLTSQQESIARANQELAGRQLPSAVAAPADGGYCEPR